MRVNGNHICGGSIIKKNWIVTAAHCVSAVSDPLAYTVLHGSTNRIVESNDKRIRQVNLIIIHPSYSKETHNNDIALLRVSKDFDLNGSSAASIELDNDHDTENLIGENCWVSGWGTLDTYFNWLPNTLQAVQMPIIVQADSFYGADYNDLTMMIAGKPLGSFFFS